MKNKENLNWDEIQQFHEEGNSLAIILKKFKISRTRLENAVKKGYFKKLKIPKVHTEKTKLILREKRLEWLKNNPDKHVWKRNSKFKSEPCEIFKKILTTSGFTFIEEYQPTYEKNYAIDIAFPDKKIGIEINGNQHYNSDKTLKQYYIDRHNYFLGIGWELYQLHYSFVFSNKVNEFILGLLNQHDIKNIDYSFYMKRKKENLCICGNKMYITSKFCIKCRHAQKSVISGRPTPEMLKTDIEELGYRGSGKKYGVSDTAIIKWAKKYGIYKKSKFRNFCKCGIKISGKGLCLKCYLKKNTKYTCKPTFDELSNDINELGVTKTAEKYNTKKSKIYKWMREFKKNAPIA